MKLNHIGLEVEGAEKLIVSLNNLLASHQLFYQNLRGFHWTVKGNQFFELHVKFEELYNDAQLKIDEIAERILTLGGTPLFNFSAYLKASDIAEVTTVLSGDQMVQKVLVDLKILLIAERSIVEIAQQINDEGTNGLISDYISSQEKLIWMLSSYIAK